MNLECGEHKRSQKLGEKNLGSTIPVVTCKTEVAEIELLRS